jgi:isochorismate synthase
MTPSPDPGFSIRSRPLPPAFDLLAACTRLPNGSFLFERNGLGLAAELVGGIGEGVEPATPSAIADLGRGAVGRLRAIPANGGPGPVAMGSFPFAAKEGVHLSIPSRTVRRLEPGRTWLIELVPGDGELDPFRPALPESARPAQPFDGLQLEEVPSAEAYAEAVGLLRTRIRAAMLRKVVLARTLELGAGRDLNPTRLARRLRSVDPDCYVFCSPVRHWIGVDVGDPPGPWPAIVGATPELLVARSGREIRSTPLAGSAPRSGDPDEDRANGDALAASPKNRQEHEIVVEAIAEGLRPFCEELNWDPEPVLKGTANVWHLATRFRGVLREPAANAVELVAALHPTPAVCGTPRDAAEGAIEELEPFERGSYAGPIGWMDANGDGEWAIALRCAELRGERATLYAGAGIVADSMPLDEVDETERKFRSFLDALRWG